MPDRPPAVPPTVLEAAQASGPDASVRALARANLYAIAAVLLILVTVVSLALWSSYRGSLREAEDRAEDAGAILAEQIDLTLVGIDNVLQGLGDRLALVPPTDKGLAGTLAQRGAELPMVRALVVVGTDGTISADSRPHEPALGLSVATHAFFRTHLLQDDADLYVGPPIHGLEDDGWIIPVSQAVRGPDGALRAVVVAALDPFYFEKLFRAIDVDGRLWGALTKTDGELLVPFPVDARLLETPIAGYAWLVARLHQSPRGAVRLRTPDGVDRLVVHSRFVRWPLVLAMGLSTDDALASFQSDARLWGLGLVVAFGLILFGARYHLHQTRRIANQARQLRRTADDLTRVNRLLEQENIERINAAAELYYRNLLLDAQLQMSPDGILVVDAGGHIRSWNQRFGEIWQLPEDLSTAADRDLALGLACGRLQDPREFIGPFGDLLRSLADDDRGGEIRFKDGRIVERFSRALNDHRGQFSGRIWFFRDVTLARRAAETARKLAAIVSSSNDAIIGKTIDGVIESWNAAAELMFGYSADEIIGRSLQGLFPPDRTADITGRLAAVRRGERVAHLETVGRHRSGGRIHLSVTISPIRDDAGTVTGLSTIARDISRRKMIEAELREHDRRNRVLLESLSEGVLLYNAAGAIVVGNTAARHILGRFLGSLDLTAEQTAAILDTIAIAADGTRVPRAHLPAEIARTNGVPVLDVVVGLRDPAAAPADTVWLLVNAQPIRAETGEIDGVVVSLLDITTRKKAEEELRESERHFRRTFDESPIGAAMVALDGRFLRVNAELCRITGYDAETLLGLGIADITLPDDRDLDAEPARQLIAGDISYYQIDKRCRRRDGSPIWLHFSVRMIRDSEGHPGTLLPMIEDITERKLAEERLARSEAEARAAKTTADLANRAKSEFLATTSHELRSPLNAILGFAEILTLEMFGPLGSERYLGYARDIHHAGQLLLSVIDDLLDLAKIEAGKLELHEEQISLETTIGTALRLVQSRAQDHGLTLITELAPNLPQLWADGRLIVQMTVNLLSNAIKFTPAGGGVTVTAALATGDAGGLVLSVSDTGIGIAPEDLPKVLTPFEQVDNHLTRTQSGTGLGLPLVKSLIELHDGRFEIVSAPETGTTVRLTFPASRLRWP
jgi:PAS domain S-box-containing protein